MMGVCLAQSRARLCYTRGNASMDAQRLRGAGRAICRSWSLTQKRTEPRPSARGPRPGRPPPGQRASTSSGQPRGATRRKRWASASREGRGHEERRLAIKIASTAPFLIPVARGFDSALVLPQSHSRPRRRKSRSGTISSHRTSPAPPPRPGTSCLPASSSLFAPPVCQILVCCFASLRPPARLICWCCRGRECACAFGFIAMGRFPGRVLLGDDALAG